MIAKVNSFEQRKLTVFILECRASEKETITRLFLKFSTSGVIYPYIREIISTYQFSTLYQNSYFFYLITFRILFFRIMYLLHTYLEYSLYNRKSASTFMQSLYLFVFSNVLRNKFNFNLIIFMFIK